VKVSLPCEVFTLDNGLRLIVHESHDAPLACVNVWYHVGSRDERPGRTGFAHLFEHLMFEGSANVPPGMFDRALEEVGGANNGSTSADRTNYWETVPSNALELALFLEADRMGGLLEALTPERFEAQRDVVMNERREAYENRPYGLAHERMLQALYPPDHPYHWPVIGFMPDIAAATVQDAEAFFREWYVPNNASIAVAGDVEIARVLELVGRHFGKLTAGPAHLREPLAPPPLAAPVRLVLEDAVQLPRVYMAWHSPAAFMNGDAELDAAAHMLSSGRASRFYRSMVAGREIAVEVSAHQQSGQLGSLFVISATARQGQPLAPLEDAVREELERFAREGADEPELDRARHAITTAFVDELQTVGGFGGRADRLNLYEHHLGDPDRVQHDLDRFLALDASTLCAAVRATLRDSHAVTLSVVPHGRTDLAARGTPLA
jgi:zinc protease